MRTFKIVLHLGEDKLYYSNGKFSSNKLKAEQFTYNQAKEVEEKLDGGPGLGFISIEDFSNYSLEQLCDDDYQLEEMSVKKINVRVLNPESEVYRQVKYYGIGSGEVRVS